MSDRWQVLFEPHGTPCPAVLVDGDRPPSVVRQAVARGQYHMTDALASGSARPLSAIRFKVVVRYNLRRVYETWALRHVNFYYRRGAALRFDAILSLKVIVQGVRRREILDTWGNIFNMCLRSSHG
jgi:hypothetical protein